MIYGGSTTIIMASSRIIVVAYRKRTTTTTKKKNLSYLSKRRIYVICFLKGGMIFLLATLRFFWSEEVCLDMALCILNELEGYA